MNTANIFATLPSEIKPVCEHPEEPPLANYDQSEPADGANAVVKLLVDAAIVDGAHHKQFFINRALALLLGAHEFDKLVTSTASQYDWQNGIAP